MKYMGDYHDHYLQKDVLLLPDVYEKFIYTCLKYYRLDPCHYFSSPGLSWDAMSHIAKRYAKANNKYINNYNPKKQPIFLSYLDMNNLYSWAMSEYLPYERFKWLKNVDELEVMSINEKVEQDIFSKLTLNILMNYINYTMIIH